MNKDIEFLMELKLLIDSKIKEAKLETITENFKKLLATMSYYNAAEGAFSEETVQREHHRAKLKEFAKDMINNGFTREDLQKICKGKYLCSESDYLTFTDRSEIQRREHD